MDARARASAPLSLMPPRATRRSSPKEHSSGEAISADNYILAADDSEKEEEGRNDGQGAWQVNVDVAWPRFVPADVFTE